MAPNHKRQFIKGRPSITISTGSMYAEKGGDIGHEQKYVHNF